MDARPDAYTGALKKIRTPSTEAYPASGLAKLWPATGRCRTLQAKMSRDVAGPQPPPAGAGGGSTWTMTAPIVAGALAVAALMLLAVRRRRRTVVRPRIT